MAKKGEKATMPTSTVQTPIKDGRQIIKPAGNRKHSAGFVFIELIAVLTIISLITAVSVLSITAMFGRTKFDKQAHAFIKVLTMAQHAAAQSDQRYTVIIDFDEWTYEMRPFSTLDTYLIMETEPVFVSGYFTDDFQLDYALYDDGYDTRNVDLEKQLFFKIFLMAGHTGWQKGAKIVVRDRDGNPYSILINRLSKNITLKPGDVDMLAPIENLRF